eukprot:1147622-Pelagomonas_calceolata.AAC.10
MTTVITVLLPGGLELILGPVFFTVFDLYKMDMLLQVVQERTRMMDLEISLKQVEWLWLALSAPCSPFTSQRLPVIGPWNSFFGTIQDSMLHQGD